MPWSADYDWTSADTLRNNPREIVLELVPALNERRENADIDISYPAIVVERGEAMSSVASKIDQAMFTSFFGHFADQTQGGGDFSGGSIPHWNQTSLNAAIGLDRPDFNNGDVVSAEWVWWMYSALNLLIWTDDRTSNDPHVDEERRFSGSGHATWAAAVAAWNAASWVTWSGDTGRHTGGTSYSIVRNKSKLPAIPAPSSLYYKADIYARFLKPGSDTYENNDYPGVGVNTLGRVHEDSTRRTGDFPSGLAEVGNFNTVTVSEPVGGGRGWRTDVYFNTDSWRIIRKFNVAGGFDYV